jgi:TfoX/Sxy family transcriptional regulator of competence genes
MAYDEALADRVRSRLAGERGLTEKAMFGGLAFLLDGNLAVGVRSDDLMVRVGPEAADEALERPHARPSYMGERLMKGWILVAPAGLAGEEELAQWVRRGVQYARGLPAKGRP